MKEALSEKVQIMAPPSLLARIDDWRFANRVATRSRAMRDLLAIALREESEKGAASAATDPRHGSTNP